MNTKERDLAIKELYAKGPRLKNGGKVYCSPWCGLNCTRKAYDLAHKKGKALAKKLGKGWTCRVWENLGWHYEARFKDREPGFTGCLRVSYWPIDHSYTAYYRDSAEHGSTAKKAVKDVLKTVTTKRDHYTKLLEAVDGCV